MPELIPELTEALRYTLIGMSMTFGAIGALVLGMYLLTALASPKKEASPESPEAPSTPKVEPVVETRDEARAMAAAAAVAVALAQDRLGPSAEPAGTSQWRRYVRTHHLQQRSRSTQQTFRKRPTFTKN